MREAARLPAVNANPYGACLRPATGMRILVGGETAERPEFDPPSLDFGMTSLSAPAGFSQSLRAQVKPLLPALAGLLLAELAREGETRLDISAFSPARFSASATAAYMRSRLRQHEAFARRH